MRTYLRLTAARWLRNRGVRLTYRDGGRRSTTSTRFVRPDGSLTLGEATVLMGYTHNRLRRLAAQGRVKVTRVGSVDRVTLAELRRLRKAG